MISEKLAESHLTLLQLTNEKDHYQAKVKFTGYDDLLFTISNLIQLSIRQIHFEEDNDGNTGATYVDTARILELAIQLLPHNEAKLLDAHIKILADKNDDA